MILSFGARLIENYLQVGKTWIIHIIHGFGADDDAGNRTRVSAVTHLANLSFSHVLFMLKKQCDIIFGQGLVSERMFVHMGEKRLFRGEKHV